MEASKMEKWRLQHVEKSISDSFANSCEIFTFHLLCKILFPTTTNKYNSREINVIIGDLISHVYPNRIYVHFYPQLKKIVENIISHMQDFETLLSMDNFMPFIDLFQQETIRVEICKSIISSCCSGHHTSDPVVINALMFMCTVLHDSVDALTVDDERRQIGELLCNVVEKINYGRDFEQQLSFYVEARGTFSNIDSVLAQLVQCVNTLSVKRREEVKGRHTKKTGAFVRACAAYCFITIPSITSVKTRLELYLLSGQVALFNHCLGQADACFKTALDVIPELSQFEEKPRNNEAFLIAYVRKFLSTLLVVPDSPDKGVLNLLRILLNILQNYEWDPQNNSLVYLYMNMLDLLCAMAQETYPYHVDKVESNDTLYGSDSKFINEINTMCSVVLGELFTQLIHLGTCRKQSILALELMVKVALKTDLDDPMMSNLVLNLWQLCQKCDNSDVKYLASNSEYLTKISLAENKIILLQLLNKMKI